MRSRMEQIHSETELKHAHMQGGPLFSYVH